MAFTVCPDSCNKVCGCRLRYDRSMEFQYIPGGVLARKDPPPVSRRPAGRTETNWKLIAMQLQADPGEWYHLATGSHAVAQYSKIGPAQTANWEPAGSYEACTRIIDGQVELYGRYVGHLMPSVEDADQSEG